MSWSPDDSCIDEIEHFPRNKIKLSDAVYIPFGFPCSGQNSCFGTQNMRKFKFSFYRWVV